ncbi:hypothetical protein AVEN_15189-1 [Araneus ventricosus]|uniref:Uncharacterized protein n=1 Tax=Araneus ventricosus TaxID=182803 RepID=A0A4Y2QIM0_ARAVE|nr:hypothetical protein AVEN_15189-1 [Araneus ventricosus]
MEGLKWMGRFDWILERYKIRDSEPPSLGSVSSPPNERSNRPNTPAQIQKITMFEVKKVTKVKNARAKWTSKIGLPCSACIIPDSTASQYIIRCR